MDNPADSFFMKDCAGRVCLVTMGNLLGLAMILLSSILNCLRSIYRYLFFTRNCFFQVGYIIIVGVIHASVIYDGLFVVLTVQPHSNPLFWPFTLLAINMFIFLVCCFSDPGMLSKQGHGAALLKHSMAIYPYDGLIFSSGGICSTCNLTKPARSKHCCVLNRCVFKFDHYCIWISNVVGGLNHRYFVALLISLSVMCVHGALATLNVFSAIITVRNLWQVQYLDANGSVQTMTSSALVRYLAVRYQRLTLSFLTLVVLSVIVGSFACYHLVLALVNQTTNERYKRHSLLKAEEEKTDEKAGGEGSAATKPTKAVKNIYDRGLWQNLLEELFPLGFLGSISEENEKDD